MYTFLLMNSYTCYVLSQTIAYTIYVSYIHIHHFQRFTFGQNGYCELLRDITHGDDYQNFRNHMR